MIKTKSGVHCETNATGNLLLNIGIDISEAMLFGLSQGLGFGVINFGKMPFPFLAGRIKQGLITENICRNLNLDLTQLRTTSKKKAWQNIREKPESLFRVVSYGTCHDGPGKARESKILRGPGISSSSG